MAPTFRLFLSSPGDAAVERRRAENVVSRLNGEFSGIARLVCIRWETEFYRAHTTFQTQIPPAADCDIVVGILRWRLGTELPPDFGERLASGEPYPSGTAFEILTAVERRKAGAELPDVYVFRYTGGAPNPRLDDPNRSAIERDWASLRGFFERWFVTPEGQFLAALNNYSSEDQFESELETLLRKWVADKGSSGRIVAWPPTKGSPFPGLSVFGAKHAPVFFGRAPEIRRATDLWREAEARGTPFLLIIGASGAGKSSLARAGLIPRVTTPGVVPETDFWRVAVMRPGDSKDGPFASLASALFQDEFSLPAEEEGRGPALPELTQGDSKTPSELAALLMHADAVAARTIANALARISERARKEDQFEREVRCHLVLLVDQLDELFASSVAAETRARFAECLKSLVATGRVWLIATLRADLYASLLELNALKDLKDSGASYDLAPPGQSELAQIVRAPAEAAELTFETDPISGERLDERLLREADRPDMLPLIQLALSRLWEARETKDGQSILPIGAFSKLGGLKGIIEEAAETALAGLGETERARLPALIRRLAEFSRATGGASALTARAVPLAEAAPDKPSKALVDALVAARLFTVSGEREATQLRLAHQRVLSDWGRAAAIAAESADFYRIRDEVEEQRQRWQDSKRRGELLLARGLPLAEAQSMVAKYGAELSPETRAFIAASRRRAQRSQLIGWGVAAVFALLAVGAILAAKVALDQKSLAQAQSIRADRNFEEAKQNEARAKQERDSALLTQSRFLADVASQRLAADDAGTAMLLALDALPDPASGIDRPYAAEAEAALFSARPHLREALIWYGIFVFSAVFSPDGRTILLGLADGTARIWDIQSKKTITLTGHSSLVASAMFSSDGNRVVTASRDRTARVWDAKTGQPLAILSGHTGELSSAAFSPDGQRVVTASNDQTARIWDAATGKTLVVLNDHSGNTMNSAEFSPDGRRVVTATREAHVWDAETGASIIVLADDSRAIQSAAFSPDNQRVVTASGDHTARIWDAETGKTVAILAGHADRLRSAVYSRDGRRIVTGSYDGTSRVWDAQTAKTIATLSGHAGVVWGASFSPDGQRVVTVSPLDKTARIWVIDLSSPAAIFQASGMVLDAEFEFGGSRFITASDTGTVRFWDAVSAQMVGQLNVGPIRNSAISPDGRNLATASGNGAQIWDVQTGSSVTTLFGHLDQVWRVAFSPDGRRLVTASADKTARIWDLLSGRTITVLKGHEDTVDSAASSPDGKRVVTASGDGTACIWDADTGEALHVLRGHGVNGVPIAVTRASFSRDGRRVVTTSYDHTARIWDAETGRSITVLTGHTDIVWGAEFSPDGRRVLTASRDKTARVWDVATGKTIAVLDGDTEDVWIAHFSPDGLRVITGSFDKTARLWRLYPTTKDLIDDAKAAVPRCLTPEQREQFFLDAEPPAWCIETGRWPYYTADWKDWLAAKRAGDNPPFPGTPDFAQWLEARKTAGR